MAAVPPPPPPRIPAGLVRGAAVNAPVGLFTLAALATTAWMAKDSYNGNRERTKQLVDEMKESNDMNYERYGWGHWSGMPAMDHFAHRLYGWTKYGPFGLFEKFKEMGIRANSFFSNVIAPNLIPIGVSIAGLYGTFGAEAVHKPFKAFGRALMTPMPVRLRNELWAFSGRALTTLGNGAMRLLSLPFQSLTHLGIASGMLFFGSYFLKRFSDAYGHDGQRQFYRDQIYNRSENV